MGNHVEYLLAWALWWWFWLLLPLGWFCSSVLFAEIIVRHVAFFKLIVEVLDCQRLLFGQVPSEGSNANAFNDSSNFYSLSMLGALALRCTNLCNTIYAILFSIACIIRDQRRLRIHL